MSVALGLCIWTGDESSKRFAVQEQVRYIADTVPLQASREVDSVCVLCVACERFPSMLLSVLITVGETHCMRITIINTSNKVSLWFNVISI